MHKWSLLSFEGYENFGLAFWEGGRVYKYYKSIDIEFYARKKKKYQNFRTIKILGQIILHFWGKLLFKSEAIINNFLFKEESLTTDLLIDDNLSSFEAVKNLWKIFE